MPHPPASLPERAMPGRSFRLRARVVAGLFCAVCFAGLAARLAWLQLAGADGYAQRALGQQLRDTAVPAGRGLILSADGVVLATNASCWTIRACPREMPEARLELAAQGLGDILELDPARLLEQFRQRSSNDCLLRRRVDQDTAGAVRDFCQQNGIAGIRILQDTRRQYPEGAFLASVLGFTNVDNVGAAGLELEYNDTLAGQDGRVLTAVNAWGYALEQSYAVLQPPVQGNTLVLTIDAAIQRYLENALTYAVAEHHAAARGVGIVLDVDTGAVVAMATVPAFDPNQPRLIYDEARRAAVDALTGQARAGALQQAQQAQWRNKAVSDLYEPGSVFKLITCAAALDAGAVGPADTFVCGPYLSVAGTRFHCANRKRHGVQTVTEALMNSCNQSLIQMGGRAAGQGGLLRLLCRLRPAGGHRHRPARRAGQEPLLHRRPDGPGRAGVLLLRAEQQGQLHRDGGGGGRHRQRRAADAPLPCGRGAQPGRRPAANHPAGLHPAGHPARNFRRDASDDGGGGDGRRRPEGPDRPPSTTRSCSALSASTSPTAGRTPAAASPPPSALRCWSRPSSISACPAPPCRPPPPWPNCQPTGTVSTESNITDSKEPRALGRVRGPAYS